jgi:hypothetical protein
VSFWPFTLCVLIFVSTAIVVGSLWFAACRWDGLFNCRNYKPLVIVVPLTFALAFLLIGFPVRTETKTAPNTEITTPPKVEKPTKRKRKPKKEASENNSDQGNRPKERDSTHREGNQ